MNSSVRRIAESCGRFFLVAAFLWLPWQTVWLIEQTVVHGSVWQFNTYALYASEVLLFIGSVCMLATRNMRLNIQKKDFLPLCAMLAAVVWSIVVTPNRPLAFQAYAWWGAASIAAWMLMHDARGRYMRALVISLCMMAFLGFTQFATQSVSESVWLGINAQNPEESGVPVVLFQDTRLLRPFGSMPHPNIFGGYMALLMLISGVLYLGKRTRPYSSIVFVFGLVGVLISFSRSAWLMGLIIYGMLWLHNKNGHFMQSMLNVTLVIGALFMMMYYPAVISRIQPQQAIEIRSIDERLSGVETSFELVRQQVWQGTGIHGYTRALKKMYPNLPGYALVPVHNTPLLILAEWGVVALVMLVTALYLLWHRIPWRGLGAAIIILSPALLFDHYLWSLYPGIIMSALTFVMSNMLNTKSYH